MALGYRGTIMGWLDERTVSVNGHDYEIGIRSMYSIYTDFDRTGIETGSNPEATPSLRVGYGASGATANRHFIIACNESMVALLPIWLSVSVGSTTVTVKVTAESAQKSETITLYDAHYEGKTYSYYFSFSNTSSNISVGSKDGGEFTLNTSISFLHATANETTIQYSWQLGGILAVKAIARDPQTTAYTENIISVQFNRTLPSGSGDMSYPCYANFDYTRGTTVFSISRDGYEDPYTQTWGSYNTVYFRLDASENIDSIGISNLRIFGAGGNNSWFVSYDVLANGDYLDSLTILEGDTPADAIRPEITSCTVSGFPNITNSGVETYINDMSRITIRPRTVAKYLSTTPTWKFRRDGETSYTDVSGAYTFTPSESQSGDEPYDLRLYLLAVDAYGVTASSETEVVLHLTNYRRPELLSFSVHRCTPTEETTGTIYTDSFTGDTYLDDESGEYSAIMVETTFAPVRRYGQSSGGTNNSSVTVTSTESAQTSKTYSAGYAADSRCVVFPADEEHSRVIAVTLSDSYTGSSPVYAQKTIGTLPVFMDFLNGGKGFAIGKIAETSYRLDIAPTWRVLLSDLKIRNYGGVSDQYLAAWMQSIESRLDTLEGNGSGSGGGSSGGDGGDGGELAIEEPAEEE